MHGSEFLFWGGLLVAGTVYEIKALRSNNDKTLSDVTRDVFHTNKKAGRVIFTVAWGAFAAWFAAHILSGRDKP